MSYSKKITIIGGGTGTYVVTSGLKQHDFDLTKIVTVFDNGGSSGRLRDEFGFLPVGDLRQSLAALAQENGKSWIRELLLYRFNKGTGLTGHNLGNLILTALQDMTGSTPKALEVAAKIFRLKGLVLPITTDQADLKITYTDGATAVGEDVLDDPSFGGKTITKLESTTSCQLHPASRQAMLETDYIIIGPGDLYGSILPNFIVAGAKDAIQQTEAKIIYIVNLMTRYTQTHNLTAQGHVNLIQQYTGRWPDYTIVNNGKIDPDIAKLYAKQFEFPVVDDLSTQSDSVLREALASPVKVEKKAGDSLPRSLMRHDQEKLTQTLLKILT